MGNLVYSARPSERWMSGLSRTPGKRVWDNIPTGVRIPPSPPNAKNQAALQAAFLLGFVRTIDPAK